MEAVQAQVLSHYRSELVERIRASGHVLSAGELTIKLAKEFGFCYGVERAIDLAYAARKVVPRPADLSCSAKSFTTPRSTTRSATWASSTIAGKAQRRGNRRSCTPSDVVIIPAFGTEVLTRAQARGEGLPVRGHDLRRRDERLETRAAVFQGNRHQHHSRQGLARGNQGHQFAGDAPTAAAITWWCSTSRKRITSAITS